jgi:hypothetical protein
MLIGIGRRPKDEPKGPVEALLACHDRIRAFSDLALRLVTTRSASSSEITDAAARVERYFRIALPLHVADEEESLRPRLVALDATIERALDAMSAEHATIEAALAELVPHWATIAADACALEGLRGGLVGETGRLHEVFAEHLANEEAAIFRFIDELAKVEQTAIAREMQSRRTTPR